MSKSLAGPGRDDQHEDIVYPATIPFLLAHLACGAAVWTGVTSEAVVLGVALYVLRMFGICAGYHRYFSHRAFKTGRTFQFLLAILAQSSAQRGVLWWAAKHRWHHKHSDTKLESTRPASVGSSTRISAGSSRRAIMKRIMEQSRIWPNTRSWFGLTVTPICRRPCSGLPRG